MPRIDPYDLLKCLSVLLSPTGGIKSKDEVQRLASLMTKFSKKLVSKCIYILILKSTETQLLDMFMNAGGWDLTFSWFSDGIKAKNWDLVLELVELLLICPVDIERLKRNNYPKVIKLLSKDQTSVDKVRNLSGKVVEKWLAVVKGTCEAQSSYVPSAQHPEEVESQPQSEGSDESIQNVKEEDQDELAVYKITIRNGPKVLAEVISERASPVDDKPEDLPSVDLTLDDPGPSGEEKSPTSSPKDVQKEEEEKEGDENKKSPQSKRTKRAPPKREASIKKKGEKRQPSPEKFTRKRQAVDKKPVEAKKPLKESKEKARERLAKEKAIKEQEEKDKAVLSKLITPSLGNIGKIPKKSKEDSEKPGKSEVMVVEPKKLPPKDPKKYNISIEARKSQTGQERPKTVKTFNSKFRSTGLEEPPPPPKSKKKEEEEKKSLKRSTSPTMDNHLSLVIPEKKLKEEEKKLEKPVAVTSPPQNHKPKPHLHTLTESDVFADALTAANPVRDTKKRKRRLSITQDKKESSPPKTDEKKPHSDHVKPVFKFYQDTLITSDDKKETDQLDKTVKDIKEELVDDIETDSSDLVSQKEVEDEVAKAELAIDKVLKEEDIKNEEREKNRLPKGVLVYVKKRKIIKKTVKWKPDNELESIQLFELDENERVNVTKTFVDMKVLERNYERMLLSRRIALDDVMEEKIPWRRPVAIAIDKDLVIPGKDSVEKDIQSSRERTTLQAIYFSRFMIPDSPAEPDLEIHAPTEPTLIPFEDLSGNSDTLSYKDNGWPEPKGFAPENTSRPIPEHNPPPQVVPTPQEFPPEAIMTQQQTFIRGPFPQGPGPYPQMATPGMMGPPEGWIPAGGDLTAPNGPHMMVGNEMMMSGMGGNGHPPSGGPMGMAPAGGMMPTHHPEMFGVARMPHPEFMPPQQGFMGPPPPGMFPPPGPGGPPFNPGNMGHPGGPPPPMGGGGAGGPPGDRPPRPWFRQNGGGPPNSNWRHPSKGSWKGRPMCNHFLRKGFCKVPKCSFRHPPGKSVSNSR